MAINIKNREVEEIVTELREETGLGTTEVILRVLREEITRRRQLRDVEQRRRRILDIVATYRAGSSAPRVSPDDVIGYDEDGLPQ